MKKMSQSIEIIVILTLFVLIISTSLTGCSLSSSIYTSKPNDEISDGTFLSPTEEIETTMTVSYDPESVSPSTGIESGADQDQSQSQIGKFVFSAKTDSGQGFHEIFEINVDGTGLHQLTNLQGRSYYPEWSPDGNSIVFIFDEGDNAQIVVMRADGSELTQLTFINSSLERYPSWSPDGTKIVFTSERDRDDEIYLMTDNGYNQTRLTNQVGGDTRPIFSPDAKKITYYSRNDGNIYVLNVDGSGQIGITNNQGMNSFPIWSPDGQQVAFISDRNGNLEVYVVNITDGDQINLSKDQGDDFLPSWSPDGRKLVFYSNRSGDNEIYLIDTEGRETVRLTTNPGNDSYPVWSPNGQQIAFLSDRDGQPEIYVMNLDGSMQTRVTNSSGVNGIFDWKSQ